ncbi:MAG TPA: isoprenylcysteine carboxylmethyltransferase family protein, partial [Candidatus Angelobacter sp.]|nr:isoprenylcysteine carboxylmethyltransferase family protein [Candidatus Angelobacter sp.]
HPFDTRDLRVTSHSITLPTPMHTFISIPRPGDRRTDWIGFVWFSGWMLINAVLAIGLFRRAPMVALFLAPTFAHEALIAVAFLIRRPLVRQSEGWAPRATAYAATFVFPAFCFVSSLWQPNWMMPSGPALFMAGVLLWNVGAYVGLWSLLTLRRSFSIVPQARALVTDGPYRIVRHPVYASYLLQYAGVALSHSNPATVAVFLAWLTAVIVRVSFEERVLAAVFPEYEAYRRRVGRFVPRLLRRRPLSVTAPADAADPRAKAGAHV